MSGETSRHVRLVEALLETVERRHHASHRVVLLVDHHRFGASRPPVLGGFTPDLFAHDLPISLRILGEAKTEVDLESERSARQLAAFLDHLALYANSTMYVAVPILCAPRARRLLALLKGAEHSNVALHVVPVGIR